MAENAPQLIELTARYQEESAPRDVDPLQSPDHLLFDFSVRGEGTIVVEGKHLVAHSGPVRLCAQGSVPSLDFRSSSIAPWITPWSWASSPRAERSSLGGATNHRSTWARTLESSSSPETIVPPPSTTASGSSNAPMLITVMAR